MKIKLDENIPTSAARRLLARGLDVHTVHDEGLRGHPDGDIWAQAQAQERFLVTQDLDFSDVRKFAPGNHHGILLVLLPDAEQWRVADYVVGWLTSPDAVTFRRCFVVATANRLRITRPPAAPDDS
ncbi:MAG: DUF5615 family PIN-like protein [Deltaproteobacteria bacterium]|nr:DUF5615 family PIN-like protein [Deltaproteobacteria bacterium]